MAIPGQRRRQIATELLEDTSVPTKGGMSVAVPSLILAAIAVWVVDRFLLHHLIWSAAYHQAAPTLHEWWWNWTTFWHRYF